jgi:RNA polymerase sigma-70 factor, ECF subfamily
MGAEESRSTISSPTPAHPAGRSERALVSAAQRGSEEAIEQIYRELWPGAHRAAFLIVHDSAAAEDIAQEAFLAAIRSLDRFDRRRPLGPWLHRIVVNRSIDWTRRRNARREVALAPELEPAVAAAPEIGGDLTAALGTLAPEQRGIVVLRHLLGYTPGEIARMLEMPRGTVNSRLRRALDRLAPLLEREARR